MSSENFILHDFKLQNHKNELAKAEEIIETQKNKLRNLQNLKQICGKTHDTLYEEVIRILDYLGRLSMPIFAIEEELENLYILQHPKSPELAKKLFNDHYEQMHYPYDLLKNRCFRILEELDELYIEVNGKNPPNWCI